MVCSNDFECADMLYQSGICEMVSQISFGLNYIDFTAHVDAIGTTGVEEFFDLKGQKTDAPSTPGIYIHRSSDGKTRKVLVK